MILAESAKFLWNKGLRNIVRRLAQRMEFTCKRVTFSDEVKAIFARIEGLNDDDAMAFWGGILRWKEKGRNKEDRESER